MNYNKVSGDADDPKFSLDKKNKGAAGEARVSSNSQVEDRGSVYDVDVKDLTFWKRMNILFTNTCFLYLMAAGFFRFFAGYSLGFLSAGFFEDRYPEYTN